ncbi:MAG: gliding motility-associated C-terminal domain-containing protein [Bacteroidetes bacterium]|nr:gliding motility-associated C-terminal domain-containing protein [Bacteroidota bacterium]
MKTLNYKIKVVSLFILCSLQYLSSNAQKEWNQWVFGNKAMIDFNSGTVQAISPNLSNINQIEGVASICDNNGNLLLYTDGVQVWNGNHVQLALPGGATSIGGHTSSTQSGIIVPHPGNANQYYVFAVDAIADANYPNSSSNDKLHYAIVDFSTDTSGIVTQIVNLNNSTGITEKVTGVRRCDGNYWIISHLVNNNTFVVYDLNQTGLNIVPQTYNVGSVHNISSDIWEAAGYLKASHDGSKLACAVRANFNSASRVEIFDFDINTGVISNSNPIVLNNLNNLSQGVEFSQDDNILYVSCGRATNLSVLYGYDLSSDNSATINGSKVMLKSSNTEWYGALQLAPDGNIYMAKMNANHLAGIINPNFLSVSNYNDNLINLGLGQSKLGLPNSIPIPSFTNQSISICQGDSIFLNGNFQTTSGVYTDSLQALVGCDSIIITTLSVNPVYFVNQDLSICQGDSIFLDGNFQTTAGIYTENLQTISGCDSIITTSLTVNPIYLVNQDLSICQSDSVFFGGQFYNITGIYSDSLQSSFGCDSIYILNLNVITSFQIFQNQSICQGDSIFLGGNYQFLAGIYIDSLQATSGCDSVVFTTLTINPTFTSNQSTSICQGDSILLGGSFQTTAGIYSDNYSSSIGCDSIVNTTLIIHPTEIINQNIEICQGDSIFLEGMFQTSAGIYTDIYNSVLGCDSNVITNLSIKSIGLATLNPITICDNDSALIFGVYQNIAGIYNQVIPNGAINGCDSVVYQELLVNSTYEIFANETICQGDSIFLGGSFQTSNGIYTDVYNSSSGCDSTITTTLIVSNNFLTNINETICQGDSIFIAGAYQFITGTFIESLISSTGCDSIVTTNLIVKLTPQIIVYSDTTIIIGSSVQLNASGGNSYFWSPDYQLDCVNCQNPIASPEITMDYVVTGYIDECNTSDTITITVSKPPILFYAPNSFTPNNDGINDIFYFYGEGIKEFEVQIFDRWGELLFESIDIDQGWNGIYKGKEVQMDVYVYKVKLKSFENEYFREIGSINVIR